MATKTKFLFNGVEVDAEEQDFEPLQERWNEYRTEDGSLVKLKAVVGKIVRLALYTADGEPVYHVNSNNVVFASAPDHLKKRPELKT